MNISTEDTALDILKRRNFQIGIRDMKGKVGIDHFLDDRLLKSPPRGRDPVLECGPGGRAPAREAREG